MANVSIFEDISQKAPSASFNKTNNKYALKLYKNSNIVAFKTQIYSFLHNATCFLNIKPLSVENIGLIFPIPTLTKLE